MGVGEFEPHLNTSLKTLFFLDEPNRTSWTFPHCFHVQLWYSCPSPPKQKNAINFLDLFLFAGKILPRPTTCALRCVWQSRKKTTHAPRLVALPWRWNQRWNRGSGTVPRIKSSTMTFPNRMRIPAQWAGRIFSPTYKFLDEIYGVPMGLPFGGNRFGRVRSNFEIWPTFDSWIGVFYRHEKHALTNQQNTHHKKGGKGFGRQATCKWNWSGYRI